MGWSHPNFSPVQTGPSTYSVSFFGQLRKSKLVFVIASATLPGRASYPNLILYQPSSPTPSWLKLQLSQSVFIHFPPQGLPFRHSLTPLSNVHSHFVISIQSAHHKLAITGFA